MIICISLGSKVFFILITFASDDSDGLPKIRMPCKNERKKTAKAYYFLNSRRMQLTQSTFLSAKDVKDSNQRHGWSRSRLVIRLNKKETNK